jgi:hypothetical protein
METYLVWEFCYKNKYSYFHIVCYGCFTFILSSVNLYEAYSESKYRFAVKRKSSKVLYKILLLSESTFFKLFFHIFDANIEALFVVGHNFLYTPLIECGRLWC